MNTVSVTSLCTSWYASSVQWSQPAFSLQHNWGIKHSFDNGILCQLFFKGQGGGAAREEKMVNLCPKKVHVTNTYL